MRVSTSIMIAKAIAAIALTTGTAGGIALATSATPTDLNTSTTIESAASAESSSVTAVTPTPTANAVVDDDDDEVADAAPAGRLDSTGTAARKSPEARAPHATGLCRASSNIATAGKAVASPAFTDLNCADAGADATADRPAGRPSVAPGNPAHGTGKPDDAGRPTNDTEGDETGETGETGEDAEESGSAAGHEATGTDDDSTRGRSEEHRQDG